MILAKFKAWAFTLLGFAVTVLGFFVMKGQRDRARDAAERYKAKAHHATVVAEQDNVIELQTRSRRADALNEIRGTGSSDLLANPNKWKDKPDQ